MLGEGKSVYFRGGLLIGNLYSSRWSYTNAHACNKSGLGGLKEHMKLGGKSWQREWEDLEWRDFRSGEEVGFDFKKLVSPMKFSMFFSKLNFKHTLKSFLIQVTSTYGNLLFPLEKWGNVPLSSCGMSPEHTL